MTELAVLLDLAEVDAELARLEARATSLATRRAGSDSMAVVDQAARRRTDAAEANDAARRTQIRLEGTLSDLEDRARRAEARLSQLSDTHQIEAAQREVDLLRDQRSATEDELLSAMEVAETALAEDEESAEAERAAREQADATEHELVGELGEAEHALAHVRARRAAMAEGIDGALLDRYEELRQKGIRPPVARFEGGRCQGCHLSLPATEVDQLRTLPPDALVFCSECGCLLVRSPRPPQGEAEPET